MTQPTFLLSPIKPAIPARGGAIDVMVRLQAPEQPEGSKAKVTPKRLSLVVDRSGSMDGQPLHEALKCVGHIAARMTADDRVSIVVYDDKVDVLVPQGPVSSPDAINRLLSTVRSGGSTDLFAGWQAGAVRPPPFVFAAGRAAGVGWGFTPPSPPPRLTPCRASHIRSRRACCRSPLSAG